MRKISSRDNAAFKLLRQLTHSARARRKEGRTVLDGIHLVSAWCERFAAPELLAVSESGALRSEIHNWLAAHPQIVPYLLDDRLFREVSPVDTPTGILAMVCVPPPPSETTVEGSCILLDAIQDAGNLGAILRTAAAVGMSDVFLGPGCAQAWSPRVLRAAMGAHFLLRLHEHAALERVLGRFGGTSIVTQPDARDSIYEADLSGPLAWVFGNEGSGVACATAARARRVLRIPMPGKIESLNVAAAAAICLFEELRQKRTLAAQKT